MSNDNVLMEIHSRLGNIEGTLESMRISQGLELKSLHTTLETFTEIEREQDQKISSLEGVQNLWKWIGIATAGILTSGGSIIAAVIWKVV